MKTAPATDLERRVLILAPVGKDAALIQSALRGDAVCTACRNFEDLALEIGRGAAAVLITEEAFIEHDGRLAALIDRQPPWSDLPILLLTRPGADSERFHPEAAFLDLGIPGMDGYEIARRIRERPDGSGCVLVALTGRGTGDDRQHTEAAGFSRHLVKPASIDAILATLEDLDQ